MMKAVRLDPEARPRMIIAVTPAETEYRGNAEVMGKLEVPS